MRYTQDMQVLINIQNNTQNNFYEKQF